MHANHYQRDPGICMREKVQRDCEAAFWTTPFTQKALYMPLGTLRSFKRSLRRCHKLEGLCSVSAETVNRKLRPSFPIRVLNAGCWSGIDGRHR